jgi:hypothetical protein
MLLLTFWQKRVVNVGRYCILLSKLRFLGDIYTLLLSLVHLFELCIFLRIHTLFWQGLIGGLTHISEKVSYASIAAYLHYVHLLGERPFWGIVAGVMDRDGQRNDMMRKCAICVRDQKKGVLL